MFCLCLTGNSNAQTSQKGYSCSTIDPAKTKCFWKSFKKSCLFPVLLPDQGGLDKAFRSLNAYQLLFLFASLYLNESLDSSSTLHGCGTSLCRHLCFSISTSQAVEGTELSFSNHKAKQTKAVVKQHLITVQELMVILSFLLLFLFFHCNILSINMYPLWHSNCRLLSIMTSHLFAQVMQHFFLKLPLYICMHLQLWFKQQL